MITLICALLIILFTYDIALILYLALENRKLRGRIHELEDMNDSLMEVISND